jgi:DNA-binding NarL/FixJ family response regulator
MEQSKIVQFSTGKPLAHRHSVLLVDDQQVFRTIARDTLTTDTVFEIVGEAVDGGNAIQMTEQLRPDVIVMDIQMPDMSGIEAARKILSDRPDVRIVLTSMGEDAEYEPLAREIGACGFVSKRELSASAVLALIEDHTPPANSSAMAA